MRSLNDSLAHLLRVARRDPWLWAAIALSSMVALASVVGMAVDPRILGEQLLWMKPFKFGVSIVIYCFTLAWIVDYLGDSRGARQALRVIAALLIVELVLITGQAARGEYSHFNISTRLNDILFAVMGIAIGAVMILSLVLAWQTLRARVGTSLTRTAIVLGLAISALGGFMGYRMPVPTPEQRAGFRQGIVERVGSHFNGAHVPGSELPLVGWSTTAGDWRIAHFIGLHTLQLLLILGWALQRSPWGHVTQMAVLWGVALAVLALFGWTFARAWMALPPL